jgi:hypothetical protein
LLDGRRAEKASEVLELAGRDVPVAAGLLEQPEGHLPGLRVFVTKQIANSPFVFPGGPHIAASGQEITSRELYCAKWFMCLREKVYNILQRRV